MRLIVACLALLIGWQAKAATVFATPSTLKAVVQAAAPGDTIVLTGQFDGPRLGTVTGLKFRCADGPTRVAGFYWGEAKDVTFTACPFYKGTIGEGLRFTRATNLTINGGSFNGAALKVTGGCDGLKVTGVAFNDNTGQGVSLANCTRILVEESVFRRSASDGIQCFSCSFARFYRNRCEDFRPKAGAHPDCIQFDSTPAGGRSHDIVIEANTLAITGQGFSSFDSAGIFNVVIRGNDIYLGNYKWAVAMARSRNVVFEDNVVRLLPGSTTKNLGMDFRGGSEPLILRGANQMDGCIPVTRCVVY